jgi:hypothetical protein
MQVSAEKFLQLEEELKLYRNAMNQALDIILEKGITEYPIFIAHQDTFEVGIPIIKRYEVAGNWNINVSSMEEFLQKRLILPQKLNHFKLTYRPPTDYICFFVLSELGAQYIFLRRE